MFEAGPDPELSFPVVTEQNFPWGLRCGLCHRIIEVGKPFQAYEESMYENGDTWAMLLCVYCPEEEED